jgi:adenosylmethionine-8-amino-7-oxononanoate aminotransferase
LTNRSFVFHYDLDAQLPVAVGGDRCWLVDGEGRRWLDACSAAGAATLGYGVEEISAAIAEQARTLAFAYRRQFTNEPMEQLAGLLVELAEGDFDRVFFVSGGSEATESALKIARLFHLEQGRPSKTNVIGRWPSYHGNTLAALAMGGRAAWREPFESMLPRVDHVPAPIALRAPDGTSAEEWGMQCADALEEAILRQGPEHVAAFIAEPIIGGSATGAVPPPRYWARIREICNRYDVVLIADEVLTGFGRTGATFAVEHWDLQPDLLVCGKGISGGYAPLGAVLVSSRVSAAFAGGSRRLQHSFTFSGHPVSCAAGVAAVNYLTANGLVAQSRELGVYALRRAEQLTAHPAVVEVRGRGLLIGVELAGNDLATRVVARMRENGVLVLGGAVDPLPDRAPTAHVQVMPPLTTRADEIDTIFDALIAAIEVEAAVEEATANEVRSVA